MVNDLSARERRTVVVLPSHSFPTLTTSPLHLVTGFRLDGARVGWIFSAEEASVTAIAGQLNAGGCLEVLECE